MDSEKSTSINVTEDISGTLKRLKSSIPEQDNDLKQVETAPKLKKEVIKLREEVKTRGLNHSVPAPSTIRKCGIDKLRMFRRELNDVLQYDKDTEKSTQQADRQVKRSYAKKRISQGAKADDVKEEISSGKHLEKSHVEVAKDLASLNLLLCQSIEVLCSSLSQNLPPESRVKQKLPDLTGWTADLQTRKESLDEVWGEIYVENQDLYEAVAGPYVRLATILGSSATKIAVENKIKKKLGNGSHLQPSQLQEL